MLNWLLPQRTAQKELLEENFELPPHGRVLHLRRASPRTPLKRDAVLNRLGGFTDGRMPFVGILIDLGGGEYQFSSGDLGAVVASIAAWSRGWVAPCAIVLDGRSASQLQTLLDITKLNTIQQLRVVSSVEAGRAHIAGFL
jgi:hypothetical protein